MWETIQPYEPVIRLSAFLGVFAVMALWEVAAPRRRLAFSRFLRWSNNLGIVALNTVVLRLLFPIAAVGMAVVAKQSGWGLLNIITLPDWLAVVLAVIALDFAIWLQHVARIAHAAMALVAFGQLGVDELGSSACDDFAAKLLLHFIE